MLGWKGFLMFKHNAYPTKINEDQGDISYTITALPNLHFEAWARQDLNKFRVCFMESENIIYVKN